MLPDAVAFGAQVISEVALHLERRFVGHRVEVLVEVRTELHAVPLHDARVLYAGLVPGEALLRREAGEADEDTRQRCVESVVDQIEALREKAASALRES